MAKPIPLRFSVAPEDEAAALAYLEARNFAPVTIEDDNEGLRVLIFEPLPDEQLFELMQALPDHLSAKRGIVMDGQMRFNSQNDN